MLLIYCFMYLQLPMGVQCWSLFWYVFLCVLSSFEIILIKKRESLLLCFNCLSYVLLLLMVCGSHGAVGWSAVCDCGIS